MQIMKILTVQFPASSYEFLPLIKKYKIFLKHTPSFFKEMSYCMKFQHTVALALTETNRLWSNFLTSDSVST